MNTPTAVITGVSRPQGIAWAVAQRLHRDGWRLSLSGWPPHDDEQPWADGSEVPQLPGVPWCAADLADPSVPRSLVDEHVARYGSLDALVAVHARSSEQSLDDVTAAELDGSFAVNARATVLLVQAAARAGVRRVVLFTTGVHTGPMPTEIPYAMSKAALQGITTTLAAALSPAGATVNCLNPGPVETGYADAATLAFVASNMPLAPRWGMPDDTAGVVAWLLSDDAGWVTGQTIDADGGWGIRSGVTPRGA
ncbi:MAG TPA: SDR family oxidoreductase [Actinomycetales bacterium]|nr:SDR family oxidoreductase [Actinomycetales bacterium]